MLLEGIRRRSIPLEEAKPALERLLAGMLDFWDERIIDEANGGFRLGHDVHGQPTGSDSRHLVTQARVAWFFARLARSPYGDRTHLAWAQHGVDYLTHRLWDDADGGFYWEVGPEGPRDARKHVYGQAFALFALSEHARSSGRAAGRARDVARLIDERAHDERHGGYMEAFESDWSVTPPGTPSLIGPPSRRKTLNSHLHLLEALSAAAAVIPDDDVHDRERELVALITGPGFDWASGSLWESCERDWSGAGGPCSYGHDLEAAWLLREASVDDDRTRDAAGRLWDSALRCGCDRSRGGFFESGPRGASADRRDKVWWVQAEALVSALVMLEATGEARYRDAFELTLGWVIRRQADSRHGDWHAVVDRRGRPSGDKSGAWKDPYHQGRAVLECLERLPGVSGSRSGETSPAPGPASDIAR